MIIISKCIRTVSSIRDDYLNLTITDNTFKVKMVWINRFISGLPIKEDTIATTITISQVNDCLRTWWKFYKNANTFNLGRQMLISFINWGYEEGFLIVRIKKTNVLGRKKKSSINRIPYSEKEIKSLITVAQRINNTKIKLILTLLITIAPRASEIANLKWSDIFYKKNYILLIRKGGELQELPICNSINSLFEHYYFEKGKPEPNNYVFSSEQKRVPDRFLIYNEIKKLAIKAEVNYRGVHLFRNTLANVFDLLNVQN